MTDHTELLARLGSYKGFDMRHTVVDPSLFTDAASAIRELTAQLEQERDIRSDRESTITAIAEALNVPFEPHQTFFERLPEVAKQERKARKEAERLFVEIRDKHQAEFLRAEAAEAALALAFKEPVAWIKPKKEMRTFSAFSVNDWIPLYHKPEVK